MKLVLPVEGFPVTLPFGAVYGADIRGKGWNYAGQRHSGVDFGCPAGTTVRASAAGKVVFCGWDSTGYGNLIRIAHPDGSETRYAHLAAFITSSGAAVYSGQPIATSGATGNVTGAHLHWEYRREDKRAVDPMEFVAKVSENVDETDENVAEPAESVIRTDDRVRIAAEIVNIRDAPAGKLIGQLRRGMIVAVLTDAGIVNGLRWRKVRSEFWVAEVDAEGTPLLTSV